ncbi:MAG: hypothetical protein NTY09_07065 [bacterium]|nr:hypothetical protein [bacterium]
MVAFPAYSDDEKNAMDYLPPTHFVSSWEATQNEVLLHPDDAAYLLGSDYNLFLEYDPVWYASNIYTNFGDELTIEIFEFGSQNDAYGFYGLSPIPYAEPDIRTGITVESYGTPPPTKIDSIRQVGTDFLEGFRGRFYFRIRQPDLPETLLSVGTYLLGELPGSTLPAEMIGILPADDRVMGSERYIRGPIGLDLLLNWTGDDVLGFDEYDWKAVGAEYRLGGGEYYLLLIAQYQDSDTAEIASTRLLDYFQNKNFETIMTPATPDGFHPRAFKDESCAAFWPNGDKIWLLWDLSDTDDLMSALQKY